MVAAPTPVEPDLLTQLGMSPEAAAATAIVALVVVGGLLLLIFILSRLLVICRPFEVLVISGRDNVATALEPLEKGRTITVRDETVLVAEPIARGHKISLRAIRAGDAVIKYGSPIGNASCDIASCQALMSRPLTRSRFTSGSCFITASQCQPVVACMTRPSIIIIHVYMRSSFGTAFMG